jgi:hypothetical protein
MAGYQMRSELLGLPNASVLCYRIMGSERIEVRISSSLEVPLCPDC